VVANGNSGIPFGRTAEEVVIDDAAGLAWIVNLGCIELHPQRSLSRAKREVFIGEPGQNHESGDSSKLNPACRLRADRVQTYLITPQAMRAPPPPRGAGVSE
jgi:hypothetical protein